jgi:hypothetical protein
MSDAHQDSIEEVLQQSSEQTLKLNHIDEAVKQLTQTVSDLGDTLQTGLLEVRNLAAQKPQTPAAIATGDDATYKQAVIERLDELERTAHASARKLMLFGVIVTVQLVLLLVVLFRAPARQTEPAPAATIQAAPTPPAPEPALQAKPPPPPEINIGKKKRR